MQDSSCKSIKLKRTAAAVSFDVIFGKAGENTGKRKKILFLSMVRAAFPILLAGSVLLLGSCKSLKDSRRAVPYGALPGDCLFYFALDPELVPLDKPDLDAGLKQLLKRTDEITGGGKRGEYYILFKGSYPDAFAERRISETPGWIKGEYKHSYYNAAANLALFFAENNHIFASNFLNTETGERPIDKIYHNYKSGTEEAPDIYFSEENADKRKTAGIYSDRSGISVNVYEYFLSRDRENLFQFYTSDVSGMLSGFPDERLISSEIKNIEVFLKRYEKNGNSFSLESRLGFSSEKEAARLSPVVKLLLLDIMRKKDSGLSVAEGKRFSVVKERNILNISDIIVSDKVTGDFFNKIVKGQVF